MGIEAHVCVTQTALSILNKNLDLVVISDGVSSVHRGDRNRALRNLENMGAYVTTSQSFLFMLLQDSMHKSFKSLLPIFKRQFNRENKLLDDSKF
jgi:isochorismate hydrolase